MDDDEKHEDSLERCNECQQFRKLYRWGICRDCYERGKADYEYDRAKDRRAEDEQK